MLQVESTPKTGGEKEILLAYLNNQRAVMAWKLHGLPVAEARRPMVPSGTSVMGVTRHLAAVELWWFGDVIAHGDYTVPESMGGWWQSVQEAYEQDPDADFRIGEGETVDQVLEYYETAAGVANDIIQRYDLDHVGRVHGPNPPVSLRWVMVHMIAETARHAGHADIIREQIDGVTGYMPE
jgi:hypothetical protein